MTVPNRNEHHPLIAISANNGSNDIL